jgi:hypothetical protein
MATKKDPAADLDMLKATVQATLDLTTKLLDTAVNTDTSINNDVNAIDLAHDTASLIRAHVTKLSLLIINKPFTPSAITKILRELVAGPLPGLASSIELCHASKYTKTMSSELTWRVKKVFRELLVFIKIIPLDGQVLSEDAKTGSKKVEGNGSLAATGVVWQACDGVIELKKIGIAGLLCKLVEEQRELIEDALWELQEWGELGSDADEDEDDFEGDDGVDDKQKELDNMFEAQKHIPTADPEGIRPRFEKATKSLKLVMLMYKAIVKRRFKTLPQLLLSDIRDVGEKDGTQQNVVGTIDTVMESLKKIPEDTDELASAFYSLKAVGIDKAMEECFSTSHEVVKMLLKNWKGEDDEFTAWVGTSFIVCYKSCC